MGSSSFFFFTFVVLFVCWGGEKVEGSTKFDKTFCPPQPLTKFGEKIREENMIFLFVYLTYTGKQPCWNERDDWREKLPQCYQNMTNIETYTYVNDTGKCASCSSLGPVNCSEVFNGRRVGLVVAVGEAHMLHYQCKKDPLTNQSTWYPPKCYFDENEYFDRRFRDPSLLSSAVRVMIPVEWQTTRTWGLIQGAQIYGMAGGKAREWVVLDDNFMPKVMHMKNRIPTKADLKMVQNIVNEKGGGWGNNMFLYVSRPDNGKGQVSFISKVIKEQQYFRAKNITFKFILSLQNTDRYTLRAKKAFREAEKFGESDLIHPLEARLTKNQLACLMHEAKGLVHFAEADRNPRILSEALNARLPILTTTQSGAFSTFECVPDSVAVVVDATNNTDSSLIPPFERLLSATKNRTKSFEDMSQVVKGLIPAETYPCLCDAIGICSNPDGPVNASSFHHFKKVFKSANVPGLSLPDKCVLGKTLTGVTCDNSDMAMCLRWGTWFDYRHRHKEGTQGLFPDSMEVILRKFLKSFHKGLCYIPHEYELFMKTVGRRTKKKTQYALERVRGGILEGGQPPEYEIPEFEKPVSESSLSQMVADVVPQIVPNFVTKTLAGVSHPRDEDEIERMGEPTRVHFHKLKEKKERREKENALGGLIKKHVGQFWGAQREH